ncbi:MAG: hypothetical protein ACXWQO_13210 [Bdellovibrionota bacterium]
MTKIFLALLFLSSIHSSFATEGAMVAKDYWLKHHNEEIAQDMCEGKIVFCMGIKREECGAMYLSAVNACGEELYKTLPDYIEKADGKKLKAQLSECARPKLREKVMVKIAQNPKHIKKEQCMEFFAPPGTAAAPKKAEALKLGMPIQAK